MATIRISEADAARDFASLMASVRAGSEVMIESNEPPVAIVHTPVHPARAFEEAVALLPERLAAVMDEDFAHDVENAIAAHREALNLPFWD